MHIEKAEDFRLRVSEGVPYRSRLSGESSGTSTTNFMPSAHSCRTWPCGKPVSRRWRGPRRPLVRHRPPSAARADIPSRDEAGIWFAPFGLTPWSVWRSPSTASPEKIGALTGVPARPEPGRFPSTASPPLVELTNRKHQSRLFCAGNAGVHGNSNAESRTPTQAECTRRRVTPYRRRT